MKKVASRMGKEDRKEKEKWRWDGEEQEMSTVQRIWGQRGGEQYEDRECT